MNKIFSKTLETLFLGHFGDFIALQAHQNFLFKNWDSSLFLLYDVKLQENK